MDSLVEILALKTIQGGFYSGVPCFYLKQGMCQSSSACNFRQLRTLLAGRDKERWPTLVAARPGCDRIAPEKTCES